MGLLVSYFIVVDAVIVIVIFLISWGKVLGWGID